jgi:hypothetical protein
MAGSPIDTEAFETWFIRRGVPHFIEGYSARTDIWVRAVPILALAYLVGGLNALDIERSALWNLATLALVLAILAAAWGVANRLRGRPAIARPTELGLFELAVFLVGPVIPPLVVSQWGDAVQAFLEGVGVLLLIYLGTSYAVVPLLRWAARRARAQIVVFFNTVTRVLPLLLLVITFLFVNAEVWQVAGRLDGVVYIIVLGLFVAFGVLFVFSRLPGMVAGMSTFAAWDEVGPMLTDTPAATLECATRTGPISVAPLDRREKLNIGLVTVFSQALQITFVVVAVFGFFVLFGYLAIPPDTVEAWITQPPHRLVGSGELVLTEELVRVAGFLAAFTGMYFTVVLSTDAMYREEVAEDAAPQIRQALAVRAAYLDTLRHRADDPDR